MVPGKSLEKFWSQSFDFQSSRLSHLTIYEMLDKVKRANLILNFDVGSSLAAVGSTNVVIGSGSIAIGSGPVLIEFRSVVGTIIIGSR